jgi:hypothetical protein
MQYALRRRRKGSNVVLLKSKAGILRTATGFQTSGLIFLPTANGILLTAGLLHRNKFDLEHQRGVRGNDPARSGFAVCKRGRYIQLPFGAGLHHLQRL